MTAPRYIGTSTATPYHMGLKQTKTTEGYTTMATAIKAIPTLKGKEARTFLRRAEKAEQNYKGTDNRDNHPYCLMAHGILSKAGML